MLLSKGSKVRLIRTGDLGRVTRVLPDGSVEVYLEEDDLSIVVAMDDLEKPGQASDRTPPPPVFDAAQPIDLSEIKSFLPRFSPYQVSVQLVYEPIEQESNGNLIYQTWLLNATSSSILYEVEMLIHGRREYIRRGTMQAVSGVELGRFYFDELSDQPEYAIEVREVEARGTGPAHRQRIKLRPRQFMQRGKKVPLIEKPIHFYTVVETLGEIPPPTENIYDYAERTVRTVRPQHRYVPVNDLQSYAEFPVDLDLHIQRLRENAKPLPAADILPFQLNACRRYLDRAAQLGVPRVFLIHGIGTGRLKERVHDILRDYPGVDRFVNEHHPKYGWGATEVIFR